MSKQTVFVVEILGNDDHDIFIVDTKEAAKQIVNDTKDKYNIRYTERCVYSKDELKYRNIYYECNYKNGIDTYESLGIDNYEAIHRFDNGLISIYATSLERLNELKSQQKDWNLK